MLQQQPCQDEEWGQFVIIHPGMYEYKQQVKPCFNKFIVNQKIGRNYLNEMGRIETIPEHNHINMNETLTDTMTYKHLLMTNTPRFLILCTIHAFNYILKIIKR